MIDQFTKQDLLKLVKTQNDPCVTFYLATEKTGRELYKPATQLKKLAETARQKLSGNWMSNTDARIFLQPAIELSENHDYWQHTDQGLALFLNADSLHKWRVGESFSEQVFVSHRFFVRSLLAASSQVEPFYILSLSRNKAELFDADETKITKIDVPNMPASVEVAMNVTSVERGSSVHTGSREHKGKQGSVFHGHGGKADVAREEAQFFYRQVDQAITQHLGDAEKPMVLAADAKQVAIYHGINTYPYLLGDVTIGYSGKLSNQQLLERALPSMKQRMIKSRRFAIDSYRERANTISTLSEASEIIAAAHVGKIDKLFFNKAASLPGEYNPVDRTIDYDSSTKDCDMDLVEETIAQTLLHGGDVYAISETEISAKQSMFATLRY